MRVTKVRRTRNLFYPNAEHYRFNLNTADGHTIIGLIYRRDTGAILPPLACKHGKHYPAIRLDYRRIPKIRELLENALLMGYTNG